MFVKQKKYVALDYRVIAAASTRIEGTWKAYIGAVEGINHNNEYEEVLKYGSQLSEEIARTIFPSFSEIPYAN